MIAELNPRQLPNHVRHRNRELLTRFIAGDRYGRAHLGRPGATMLYNARGVFCYALRGGLSPKAQARLAERTPIRFWSKGI